MARMPFYSDPVFLQKAQNLGSYSPVSGGPFTATRNAVAASLGANRNAALGNNLGLAQANAGRQQALFNNNLAWQTWQGRVGRAATDIRAQEQLAYQRRLEEARRQAEKKAKKRGMVGSALGAIGGGLGLFFSGGNPMGGAAGMQAGNSLGGLF